jgi:hypothetical protein
MQGLKPQRPMTHDLTLRMIEQFGARIERVVVNKILEQTFYAEIMMVQGEQTFRVDARPSDAVALAVRTDAEIYVAREVLEKVDGTTTAGTAIAQGEIRFGFQELPVQAGVFFVELPQKLQEFAIEERQWEGQLMKAIPLPMFGRGAMILVSPEDWAQTLEKAAHIQEPEKAFKAEAQIVFDQIVSREVMVGDEPMREVKLPLFGESTLLVANSQYLDLFAAHHEKVSWLMQQPALAAQQLLSQADDPAGESTSESGTD